MFWIYYSTSKCSWNVHNSSEPKVRVLEHSTSDGVHTTYRCGCTPVFMFVVSISCGIMILLACRNPAWLLGGQTCIECMNYVCFGLDFRSTLPVYFPCKDCMLCKVCVLVCSAMEVHASLVVIDLVKLRWPCSLLLFLSCVLQVVPVCRWSNYRVYQYGVCVVWRVVTWWLDQGK